jgi:hypothetical protein
MERWVRAVQQSGGKIPHPDPKNAGATRTNRKKNTPESPVSELNQVLGHYNRRRDISLYGKDNGVTALSAAGKLDPATVGKMLSKKGIDRDTFSKALFNAVRIGVRDRVKDKIKQAEGLIDKLQRNPAGLASKLSQMKEAQRVKTLRALGIDADAAKRIARSPKSKTGDLRQALAKVKQTLRTAMHHANVGALDDRHSEAMFRLFKPVVNEMRSNLGIKKGSFTDQAIKSGLARCKTARKIDTALTIAASIVGALAGGVITASLHWGISAGVGAVTAGITGAPGLAKGKGNLDAALGAKSAGVARKGAVKDARKAYKAAKINYGKGIVLGAASGGGGSAAGKAAGEAAKKAAGKEATEAAVNGVAGVIGDTANRVGDAVVDRATK